jgi:apolipoprotein N-acyltransferase
MNIRRLVGSILLIGGIMCCLAWLLFSLFVFFYPDNDLKNFTSIAVVIGIWLAIGSLVTLGGWFLINPPKWIRIQKLIGWVFVTIGIFGIALSILGLVSNDDYSTTVCLLCLIFFILVVFGGGLLSRPKSKKRKRKRVQAAPQSPAEPSEEDQHPRQ